MPERAGTMDMDHIAPGLERLIDPLEKLEIVAHGMAFGEGPVWDRRTRELYWVDIIGSSIWKWKPGGGKALVMHPTGFANGMTFDKEGRLLVCGWSSRNVWRMEKDGSTTILTERCDGKKYNSPNDIVMRSDGTVYFTDSAGGLVNIGMVATGTDIQRQADVQGVYRISPDGKTVSLATGAISYPNGLALSPDEKLLYVNDTRVNKLYVHDVRPDGSLSETREWVQLQGREAGNADGMKVDSEGNVYTSGPGGIHILDAQARLLGRIRFPAHVSNFCWGEDDWRTLFITDHHNVYRTRVKIPGVPVW
jgi:gluconolactonase